VSSNQAFRALADPGEMTAGALAEKFDMSKSSMSHLFAVLRDADLITSRRDGHRSGTR
jgi:ArsR family transcriptional regulator